MRRKSNNRTDWGRQYTKDKTEMSNILRRCVYNVIYKLLRQRDRVKQIFRDKGWSIICQEILHHTNEGKLPYISGSSKNSSLGCKTCIHFPQPKRKQSSFTVLCSIILYFCIYVQTDYTVWSIFVILWLSILFSCVKPNHSVICNFHANKSCLNLCSGWAKPLCN